VCYNVPTADMHRAFCARPQSLVFTQSIVNKHDVSYILYMQTILFIYFGLHPSKNYQLVPSKLGAILNVVALRIDSILLKFELY